MIVVRTLYGLRSSGAVFRDLLAEVLYDIEYVLTKDDPDIYLRSVLKTNGFKYYEYILLYVEDKLCISENPMTNMKGLQ